MLQCGAPVRSIESRVMALPNSRTTPRGVHIRVEPGVSVSAAILDAIDTGVARTIAKVRCKYGRSLSHANYQFAIVKGETYNGNPVYQLPCGQYCGTEYDKGGFIYAAGQMIAVGEPHGNLIAIPEQGNDVTNAETISEYEAEHVELAYWDGDEFERTKTHGGGAGHPIIPNCAQKR